MTTSDDKWFGDDNRRLEAKILKNPMDCNGFIQQVRISALQAGAGWRRLLQTAAGSAASELNASVK